MLKRDLQRVLLTTIISIHTLSGAYGQSQEKIYSLLLINFARGINWPLAIENEQFVIGVVEYAPLVKELKISSTNSKVNGKKIEVREISSVNDDIRGCHILFLPAYKTKLLLHLLQETESSPVLIVSNKNDLARKGAGINFVLHDGKLNYEINCKAIEKKGMKVSTAVKNSGIIVE